MFRIACVVAISVAGSAIAQTHTVKLNGHTFTLPQGFTIELAAGADLAPRPIACDFDEKGRLYVTDSSGSNEKVKDQLAKKPHRVLRLEDTNGDGTFDKQTVFVKNIMFPEGCMWLNGSVYVAAPPHIWKFTDTNDDGVADKEEIWFDGKTLNGCANDLHGPYRGPDGWVYWCKGAFEQQEYTLPNGKKFTTRAAHIFRAMPDGGHIEPVMTGGMDNPVDLVFTPGGDIIFSTTFFQHPANGKRDGLVHAIYGAVYGKDHSVVYDHPWTQPTLMPPMTHMGPAAPCGLHRYESDQFGKEYANNLFACQFNLRKVSRHVVVPKGSTYETKDSDFVVSDNIDFHPTDVIEDADGSLLIVDTGGWYKLCCPTSQLVKPDVTGAIYRVKRNGAHKIDDPRGLKIAWKKLDEMALGKLLHDPRPAVRRQVMDFVDSPEDQITPFDVAVAGLTAGTTEHGAVAAAWLIAHDIRPVSLSLAAGLTYHPNEEVRKAALHVLAFAAPFVTDFSDYAEKRLKDKSPAVRRVAAMAVGRLKDTFAIDAIFTALADETNDRELDHALTYALIEIGDMKRTREGLTSKSPRVRRAVLAALENIPNSGLEAKTVLAELDAEDAALRDTAWWIAGRHPQWGDNLTGYFTKKLATAEKLSPEERTEFASRLVKFTGTQSVQTLLAKTAQSGTRQAKLLALGVMARSGLKAMPTGWARGITDGLTAGDLDLLRAACAVYRAVPGTKEEYKALEDQVKFHWRDRSAKLPPLEDHFLMLASAPQGYEMGAGDFRLCVGKLDRGEPVERRNGAVEALLRAGLTREQLAELADALPTTTPVEVTKLLPAFDRLKDETVVGLALVKALRNPSVQPTVRLELVKPLLDKYTTAEVKTGAAKLYDELAEARKGEREKLDKLLAELKPGDIRRGQIVFNSAKTQCIACHKVGYVGGTSGPDLTRIGSIRTERDLLESIVFPSASFVRSYEPVRVVTTDDRTFNGILKKDAPDEVIVVVAADKEERVARADVASISPSTVSIMPAGLDQQLTPQDLADLVAFLRACK